MKKIKIAQIGTSRNSHGCDIWECLLRNQDVFEIVGYAFPENEKEKFKDKLYLFDGYREMTVEEIINDSEIEAVCVETEEIYLTKYALMVARSGKHLHMEKPGGPDLSEFRALIEVLKEKRLAFSMGYMYRFNPKIREAIDKVKQGDLGEIYSVEAQMNCSHDIDLREWLSILPGGVLYFLGCHLIDLVYTIQGEPEEIIPLSCSTGFDNVNTLDFGMAIFKYKNGLSFIKTCDNERGGYLRRNLVICGKKGTIEIKPLEAYHDKRFMYAESQETYDSEWLKPWTKSRSELFDRYDAMMRNFGELVRGKENPYTYDYELKLYEIILKACGA